MRYKTMNELEVRVLKTAGKRRVAVVEAGDAHVLEAVEHAARAGLVTPLLYGNKAKIEEKISALGLSGSGWEIFDAQRPEDSAVAAGLAVKLGQADFIMKGLISTGALLKALFKEETGFRTGKLISHMNIVEVPTYHKLLALCDAAINIAPSLKQKRGILENAVRTLNRMGINNPKVALLSSAETPNPKIVASEDAAALERMYLDGEIKDCVVDGPLSYDLAICEESAKTKGYGGPVAGDADLLVCPDIVSANILIKCLRHSAGALTAGVVVGGRAPVVLLSRAASPEDKYRTMVLAATATL